MLNANSVANSVSGARTNNSEGRSPDRCPTSEQCEAGRHQTTARKRWTKKETKAVFLT